MQFSCFTNPVTIPEYLYQSCKNSLQYFNEVEVLNQDVILNITQAQTINDYQFFPLQEVRLHDPIRWYNSKSMTNAIEIYSRVASVTTFTISGVCLALVISVGVTLLKLT